MRRRDFLHLHAAALLAAAAPRALAEAAGEAAPAAKSPKVKTAGIELIPVEGGKYKVWTKKVGSGKTKMLTLHGGPGCTHEYFECFEDFLPQAGVTFYYYDQLGSAYSDQPDDKSLWNIERFREEVETVRRALGLEDFVLLGHSWGSMLGIEYALKYQKHLKALVLSNMTASIPSYVTYMSVLRSRLPAEDVKTLEKYEAEGKYEAPEYQAVLGKLYKEHICRLDPWPDPVDRTFKHLAAPVYNAIQGNNEFVVTGNMKDWDRWADLPKITVPTLVCASKHDEMSVEDLTRMSKLLPKGRLSVTNGSHLAMWDDQEAYFRDLLRFLKDVAGPAPAVKKT